jgi:hypothetical protein
MNALVRAIFIALLVLPAGLAHAIEAISVQPEQEKVDITAKGELYEGRGDKLQIETAPGPDGYIGRLACLCPVEPDVRAHRAMAGSAALHARQFARVLA